MVVVTSFGKMKCFLKTCISDLILVRACWVIKGLLGHSCEYQRWYQMSHDHMLLQACTVHDLSRQALAQSCGIIPSAL